MKRSPVTKHNMQVREDVLKQVSDISLKAIVPWYPSLDYTRTREQRRATCLNRLNFSSSEGSTAEARGQLVAVEVNTLGWLDGA